MMVLGYCSIYTNLPVFSLMYDRDIDVKQVLKFPTMYKELQKGRELSMKSFLYWFFMSLFQASVIMISSVLLNDKFALKISTVAFTCLIIAEQLNVYSEINKLHPVMIFSFLFTITTYVASIVFFKSVMDVSYLSPENVLKLLCITVASWLPFFIINKIRKICSPKSFEKLNNLT